MRFPQLKPAIFLERRGLFRALVELEGHKEEVYLPNSGRLEGVLLPGARALLAEKKGQRRKTSHDLLLMELSGVMISVDSRVPNELLLESLLNSRLPPFWGYRRIIREARLPEGRIDFLLTRGSERCFLEAKSVTLVSKGRALFPDAPTSRGRKHLELLKQVVKQGSRAAVIFVVQRGDALCFSPNGSLDPGFALALRQAAEEGVEVYAYGCQVLLEEIKLAEELPVLL